MRESMNSYSNRENEDKRDHLEDRKAPNNTVIYGGEDEGDNEESTVQCVRHHRRKGKELEHLYSSES
jgi:hypothetical protein